MSRAAHLRELAALAELKRIAEERAEDFKAQAENATRLHELERRRFDDLAVETALLRQRLADMAQAKDGEAKQRSQVTQAIRDAARGPDGRIDPRLVEHLRGQFNRLVREGAEVEDAIKAIGEWETTEASDALTPDKVLAAAGVELKG